jgi:hypothetical protein
LSHCTRRASAACICYRSSSPSARPQGTARTKKAHLIRLKSQGFKASGGSRSVRWYEDIASPATTFNTLIRTLATSHVCAYYPPRLPDDPSTTNSTHNLQGTQTIKSTCTAIGCWCMYLALPSHPYLQLEALVIEINASHQTKSPHTCEDPARTVVHYHHLTVTYLETYRLSCTE